ncbi:MAG: hypothetical protein RL536_133 [Candidatus Parcubacteria bacterium]|jgi:arginyl-tRNA--protein-N-Asp/Glu arginylyltransferase
MTYLHWDQKTITDFSEKNISQLYSRGYLFTRLGKGAMHLTRNVRINLNKFTLSSENRRILKKVDGVNFELATIPYAGYEWSIGKLAKDFYETKFGPGIMSAIKVKELLTSAEKSNFNSLILYTKDGLIEGYAICYSNKDILHYSYPFYDLSTSSKDMGLGMMILAIEYAKKVGMKYIYLGSLQRPTDTYKLQFEGLEWFDGKNWSDDQEKVREILTRS